MLQFFGSINRPPGPSIYGDVDPGLPNFLSNVIRLLVVVAGIYSLFNFILAGYQFISAGGNPKSIDQAWSKIWQSIVGLLIVAAAFLLAAIVGSLLFKDPQILLRPRIFGP